MSLQKTYFSIEGNIGSGKSTVLRSLQKANGTHVDCFPEAVKLYSSFLACDNTMFNPLQEMYADPIKSAGFAQFHILRICSDYYTLRYLESPKRVLVSERSLLSPSAFIEANFQNGYFSSFGKEYLKKELEILQCKCAGTLPDYVIFLNASPALCYERMKGRGRAEENVVPKKYLEVVGQTIFNYCAKHPSTTFTINVEEDTSKESVLSQVQKIIFSAQA